MYKFSIIVPVYNVEKYLAKCLDSLINQTYTNIEIICINDGSTDNSLHILKNYAQKDRRIIVINQENQGVSAARNKGLEVATGDYVFFIDADDWINLKTCEIINEKILQYKNLDIIQYQHIINNLDGKEHFITNRYHIEACVKSFQDLEKLIINSSVVYCWDKVYNLEFLKNNNIIFPVNIKAFEDYIFIAMIYKYNPRVLVINEHLYTYNKNLSSVCSKNAYKKFLMNKEAFKKLQEELLTVDNESLILISYNYYLRIILGLWNDLYFSSYKSEFLEELSFIESLIVKKFKTVKLFKYNFHMLLAKLHLSFFYWRVIRPVGKHFIVLPLRKIQNLRRNNEK